MHIQQFIETLSSKSPVPGGGGASALIGAVSASLCSMVANLTSGKKKYAAYQADIDAILARAGESAERLLGLMDRDAEVFEPLSRAYGIPKDEPGRDETVEKALSAAATVPMDILKEVSGIQDMLEELAEKGSKLTISDVGVAAAACRAALEGAAMNVYANTKLMKDRERAQQLNNETNELLTAGRERCEAVYRRVAGELGAGI
jgi:formiminotetrahydrofolate cyclodeaminase